MAKLIHFDFYVPEMTKEQAVHLSDLIITDLKSAGLEPAGMFFEEDVPVEEEADNGEGK